MDNKVHLIQLNLQINTLINTQINFTKNQKMCSFLHIVFISILNHISTSCQSIEIM